MGGGMALGAVLIYYKPDTRCAGPLRVGQAARESDPSRATGKRLTHLLARFVLCSLEGWARKEAEARLAAKGETVSRSFSHRAVPSC